jgi:CPA2 family monovalent cation:H+ antiporter-2
VLAEPEEGAQGAARAPSTGRRAVVAGFGPIGRNLVERLEAEGMRCTIVDLNPRTVITQRSLGREVVLGDISNREVLEAAGVREAEAVLLTVPDEDATLRACQLIRSMAPRVVIAARTNVLSRAILAKSLGADLVTVEEMATAETMARQVTGLLKSRGSP